MIFSSMPVSSWHLPNPCPKQLLCSRCYHVCMGLACAVNSINLRRICAAPQPKSFGSIESRQEKLAPRSDLKYHISRRRYLCRLALDLSEEAKRRRDQISLVWNSFGKDCLVRAPRALSFEVYIRLQYFRDSVLALPLSCGNNNICCEKAAERQVARP
jgi:hypothetical protein